MNPYSRLEHLTKYPEIHNQPLSLSTSEVEHPFRVLYNFFDIYNLPAFRHSLRNLLEDAMRGTDEDALSHYLTADNTTRLVEAAWLLYQKAKEEGKAMTTADDEEVIGAQVPVSFCKPLRLMDTTKAAPIQALHDVFMTTGHPQLRNAVTTWQNLALTVKSNTYNTPVERATLVEFCTALQHLVEAAYVKTRINKIEERSGFPLSRPVGLKAEIMEKEHVTLLSEDDIHSPLRYITHFFSRFSLLHCRAELWHMLRCVIDHPTEEKPRQNAIEIYECLYTIIEAAWHLHANPEAVKTGEKEE